MPPREREKTDKRDSTAGIKERRTREQRYTMGNKGIKNMPEFAAGVPCSYLAAASQICSQHGLAVKSTDSLFVSH